MSCAAEDKLEEPILQSSGLTTKQQKCVTALVMVVIHTYMTVLHGTRHRKIKNGSVFVKLIHILVLLRAFLTHFEFMCSHEA